MLTLNLICFFSVISIFCLSNIVTKANKVSCRDEEGREVDWFYMYKLPKHYVSNKIEKDETGLYYFYITSNNYNEWQFSTHKINDAQSMLALTLQPLNDDASVLLLVYNDEFPNGTVIQNRGHTKGVVATDGKTSIWLSHSVPKFPSIPKYEYPTTGAHYAQSFLCLTMGEEEIHKIGTQLIYNEPNIYFSRVPVVLQGKYAELEMAMQMVKQKSPPYFNQVDLETLGGKKFKSFAKSSKFKKDLYEDWLAPSLDVNLLVETWRNGAGNMASNCTNDEKVYNIDHINVQPFQLSFTTTNDHSKWAVSEATGLKIWRWRIGGADWICVGDINRQLHQMERGGGTICQKSSRVANLYRNLIGSFEPCKKTK